MARFWRIGNLPNRIGGMPGRLDGQGGSSGKNNRLNQSGGIEEKPSGVMAMAMSAAIMKRTTGAAVANQTAYQIIGEQA